MEVEASGGDREIFLRDVKKDIKRFGLSQGNIFTTSNNNNNDRLTAFDPGQPG